jgi:hypothetical protein
MSRPIRGVAHPHWRERVRDRIGPEVDADWLYCRLRESIETGDGWATRKAKQPNGKEVWYFQLEGTRHYAVVGYHHHSGAPMPITVLLDFMAVHMAKGKVKSLRAPARWSITGRKASRDKPGKRPNTAWRGDDD